MALTFDLENSFTMKNMCTRFDFLALLVPLSFQQGTAHQIHRQHTDRHTALYKNTTRLWLLNMSVKSDPNFICFVSILFCAYEITHVSLTSVFDHETIGFFL